MKKISSKDALLAHLINGHSVSQLEAMLLFGVQCPVADIYRMKNDGYLIGKQKVAMAKVIARINNFASVVPPAALPVKEILVTEYWIKS